MKPSTRPLLPLAALLALLTGASCAEESVKKSYSRVEVAPLALDFGLVEGGGSKTLSLAITNTGNRVLSVADAAVRNDAHSAFSVGALPEEIGVGATVTVEVTYAAPEEEGADGAQYVIVSDADNAPELAISLTARSAGMCLLGFAFCDGACVDTAADNAHCGDCTTACQAPEICLQGVCGCRARACAALECGDGEDGCGAVLHCGDCASPSVCLARQCVAPTCTDGQKDGDETDTDCGGTCPDCKLGGRCATSADCEAGLACIDGFCSHCRTIEDCPSDQICNGDKLCGACSTREECGDDRACLAGRCLSCPDEAAYNECGLCGGAPVSSKGAPCTLPSGCKSSYGCNTQLNGVECTEVPVNECGLCGGTAVSGLRDECFASSGCKSEMICDDAKTGTVCAEVLENACEVCGGPAITGLGATCKDTVSDCVSEYVCNDDGTGVVCAAVARNECELCGGKAVSGLGDECFASSGCKSELVCDDAKTGTVCKEIVENACQVCGGPTIVGLRAPCKDTGSDCDSEYVCNGDGTGVVCATVLRNECELCGGTAVSGLGNDCTDTGSDCPSKLVCDDAKTGTTCKAVLRNACLVCGGDTITGLGAFCKDTASDCDSEYVCNGDGSGVVCGTVTRNECELCGGTSVSGLGDDCIDTTSDCPSKLVCDDAKTGTTCAQVLKNDCLVCGGDTIIGLGDICTGTSGCTGHLRCNLAGDGTECDAPASCAVADHLVISQLAGNMGNNQSNEFIELYNPTANAIALSGYTLWYRGSDKLAAGDWISLVTLGSVSLPAHRYFLAAFATGSYGSMANDTYNSANISTTTGQVILTRTSTRPAALPAPTDSGYVDFVGYGIAKDYEGGGAAPGLDINYALVRKARSTSTAATMVSGGSDDGQGNGVDTDVNSADFVLLTSGFAPRSLSSPAEP